MCNGAKNPSVRLLCFQELSTMKVKHEEDDGGEIFLLLLWLSAYEYTSQL